MPPPPRAVTRLAATAVALLIPAAGAAQESAAGDYRFTRDWTSPIANVWPLYLKKFVGRPDVHGLEVGCFEGRTTIWLLEHVLTHETSTMTCIDVFSDEIESRFDHNVAVSGLADRITKLKGYSQDVLRGLDYERFDVVYIDGCHTASCVLTDAVLSFDLVKTGGIIIFDDYAWKLGQPPIERPKIAIDAFLEAFRDRLAVGRIGRQVIVEKVEGRSREALVGHPIVHGEAARSPEAAPGSR